MTQKGRVALEANAAFLIADLSFHEASEHASNYAFTVPLFRPAHHSTHSGKSM